MLYSRSSKLSRSKSRHMNSLTFLIAIVSLIELPKTVTCFSACSPFIYNSISDNNLIRFSTSSSSKLAATASKDDDVSRQLAKARELIEQSKAKMAALKEEEEADESTKVVTEEVEMTIDLESSREAEKRMKVTKSTDDESGLITTDGDLMAMLSEAEDWEIRDMFDVFEDETEESEVSKQLAKRDVAASLYGLRISMQNEDYSKIFNKRDRWIGEF